MAGKRANLTVLLKLNSKKFALGLKNAKAAAARFAAGVGKLGLNVARKAMQAFTVATAAAAASLVVGVKKALDFGGRMSDVADQTGLSVRNIMIWEEALRQGGMSGEEFGNIVGKMQKSVFDFSKGLSTQRDAFMGLGISLDDIIDLSGDEQLDLISKKLNDIENDSIRVGIARDIFGRQGAKLFSTTGNNSFWDKAKQSLGPGQIEIFERQAQTFDRISDIMGSIGIKLRGFFAGVADKVAPMLLKIAEKFDKIDLASKGQAFGSLLAGIVTNFKDAMIQAMIMAGAELANGVRRAILGAWALIPGVSFDGVNHFTGGGKVDATMREMREDFIQTIQSMARGAFGGGGVAGGGGGASGSSGAAGAAGAASMLGAGRIDALGNELSLDHALALRKKRAGEGGKFPGLEAVARGKSKELKAQELTAEKVSQMSSDVEQLTKAVKAAL